jgi:DNA-directed RNA polymerase subunit RPC12/RpoP
MRKTCLRCDWEGDTREVACPGCGVRLFEVGVPSTAKADVQAPSHQGEQTREATSTESCNTHGHLVTGWRSDPIARSGVGRLSSRQSRRIPLRCDAALGTTRRRVAYDLPLVRHLQRVFMANQGIWARSAG